MTVDRGMGWQRGEMRGRQNLRIRKRRDRADEDHYYRSALTLNQGTSELSAAYALWHCLVIHDRAFVGISPEGLARLAGSGKRIETLMALLQRHGLIERVYWMAQADRLREALVLGPVIVGSPWWAEMLVPNAAGFVRVAGRIIGRHAYLIVGYDEKRQAFRMLNSWGPAWGQLGRAWIDRLEMQTILAQGEACVPILASESGSRMQKIFAQGVRS